MTGYGFQVRPNFAAGVADTVTYDTHAIKYRPAARRVARKFERGLELLDNLGPAGGNKNGRREFTDAFGTVLEQPGALRRIQGERVIGCGATRPVAQAQF